MEQGAAGTSSHREGRIPLLTLASARFSQSQIAFAFAIALFVATASIVIGSRAELVGSDTALYMSLYSAMLQGSEPLFRFELLYEALAESFASLGLPAAFLFTFLSILGFACVIVSAREMAKYFGEGCSAMGYLFVLLATLAVSPVFMSAQTNVMRQGLAALVLVVFAILFLRRVNPLVLAGVAALAVGFHYSSVIYLASIVAVARLRPRVVHGVAGLLTVSYVTGLSEMLVAFASSVSPVDIYGAIVAYGAGYEYQRGVRLDFAVFTVAAGVAVSLVGLSVLGAQFRQRFLSLANVYWALILPFMLFGFGAFSDRFLLDGWLYLSWLAALVGYALVVRWRVPSAVLLAGCALAVLALCVRVSGYAVVAA